jgi:hypothetical protein
LYSVGRDVNLEWRQFQIAFAVSSTTTGTVEAYLKEYADWVLKFVVLQDL